VQHHDGVPGTESPAVKIMYIQHLKEGFDNATDAMAEMMSDLVSPSEGCHSDKLSSQVLNDDKNTGIANENSTIPIIVYNPLGWSVKRYVHINVSTQQVSVKDSDGSNVPAQ
ncbi:epididymis-specific alpha-mannosidase-like, partial [Saccoglossus kowalevskii]